MAGPVRSKRSIPTARCLPILEWPEQDRHAWQRACARGGLLDDGGLAANWRASTQETIAKGYGRWLAFLISSDLLDPDIPPAARVTRARVDAYIADLTAANNASGTIHIRILQLCRAIDAMCPGSRPAWLGRILARARAAVQPTRDDRARLVPASSLLDLAYTLMNRAEHGDWSPRLGAVTYRDGLMIIMFLTTGLRVGNLARLRLGHSLVCRTNGWWVSFSDAETKGRRRIDLPLPCELTPLVERYLKTWRPMLLQRPGVREVGPDTDPGFLWLGRYGGAFGPKKVNKRINDVTRREFGQAMNPHLFRKLVPTELAIHDPANVGIAQPLLGHASYDTTQKYYNLGKSMDAARRVQATMVSIREPKDTQ
jgi:integrase/recombinase XerD